MDYGTIISQFFIEVVFPVLGAIVLVLIGIAVRKISNKYDMEWLIDHQVMLQDMAVGAISYVEEIAANKAKQKFGDKITGKEKLDMAIIWMIERMPEISVEEAQTWIESMLGRVEGPGATEEKSIE